MCRRMSLQRALPEDSWVLKVVMWKTEISDIKLYFQTVSACKVLHPGMNVVSLWRMPLCTIVNVQLDHGTILVAPRYTHVQREHCRHPLYSQGQVTIAIGLVGSHDGQYTTAYIIVHTPWSHSAIYTRNQMFFCFLLFLIFLMQSNTWCYQYSVL